MFDICIGAVGSEGADLDLYGVGGGGADLVDGDGDGGVFEADAGLEAEGLFEHGGRYFWFAVAVADDAPSHHVGVAEGVAVIERKKFTLFGEKHCVLMIIDQRGYSSPGNKVTLFANGHPAFGVGFPQHGLRRRVGIGRYFDGD